VWVHRSDWPDPKPINVVNVGVEKHLYSLVDPQPNVPADVLERGLSDMIDGPASALIPRLIAGDALSADDRLLFAQHLYLQHARSPWMKREGMRLFAQSHEFALDGFLKSAKAREELIDLAPEEIRGLARELIEARGLKIEVSADLWVVTIIQQLFETDIPTRIAALPWRLIETKTGTFVTSDLPVVNARVADHARNAIRRGWYSDAFETVYPLGPTHVLLIRAGQPTMPGLATAQWRKDVNRRMIGAALREVYAYQPRPEIMQSIGQLTARGLRFETMDMPDRSRLLHYEMPEISGLAFREGG
jgi:hypothetical protein